MTIRRLHPNNLYSHAVIHGGHVYLSGQVSDKGTTVTEQTREVLSKIDRLLDEAGSHRSKILQTMVWLKDAADFPAMNQVWEAWVPSEQLPARSTCQVGLMGPEFKVEITIVAAADLP